MKKSKLDEFLKSIQQEIAMTMHHARNPPHQVSSQSATPHVICLPDAKFKGYSKGEIQFKRNIKKRRRSSRWGEVVGVGVSGIAGGGNQSLRVVELSKQEQHRILTRSPSKQNQQPASTNTSSWQNPTTRIPKTLCPHIISSSQSFFQKMMPINLSNSLNQSRVMQTSLIMENTAHMLTKKQYTILMGYFRGLGKQQEWKAAGKEEGKVGNGKEEGNLGNGLQQRGQENLGKGKKEGDFRIRVEDWIILCNQMKITQIYRTGVLGLAELFKKVQDWDKKIDFLGFLGLLLKVVSQMVDQQMGQAKWGQQSYIKNRKKRINYLLNKLVRMSPEQQQTPMIGKSPGPTKSARNPKTLIRAYNSKYKLRSSIPSQSEQKNKKSYSYLPKILCKGDENNASRTLGTRSSIYPADDFGVPGGVGGVGGVGGAVKVERISLGKKGKGKKGCSGEGGAQLTVQCEMIR